MILKPKTQDAIRIWDFLKNHGLDINITSILRNIKDANVSLISVEKEINGVILAQKLHNMLEINAWAVKKEDIALFKELYTKCKALKLKRIGVIEKEGKKKRIEMLKKLGFKEINKQKGIYPNKKAIIFAKELK